MDSIELLARIGDLQTIATALAVILISVGVAFYMVPVGECDKCDHCRNERLQAAQAKRWPMCPVCFTRHAPSDPHRGR